MLSIKAPDETVLVTFDFANLTASVSNPSVTATNVMGATDLTPSSILLGSTQAAGSKVTQIVAGGVDGAYYELRCRALGADGVSVFVLSDVLPILTV